MAILDSCPGLEVKIVSNDRTLEEYRDARAEYANNSTTHYVQVESDGTFQIILQATDAYRSRHGIHVEIRLDGHKVDGSLIRLKNLHKTGGHVFYGAQSKMNGKWFISDLKFSQFVLDLTSRTQMDEETTERLNSVGTITVLVSRFKTHRSRGRSSRRVKQARGDRSHGISEFGCIPEEVVKNLGLFHHGSVDNPRRNKGLRAMRSVAIDGYGDEKAQTVFVFKYRSLAILQVIGVTPTIPQTVGGLLLSNSLVAIPVCQSRAPTEVPGANREIVTASAVTTAATPPATGDFEGLTEEEIIALIAHHCGHSQGLHGQARSRLLVLLNYHEAKNQANA